MERLILPIFAVFGFLGSYFFDTAGPGSIDKVTQTNRATTESDS